MLHRDRAERMIGKTPEECCVHQDPKEVMDKLTSIENLINSNIEQKVKVRIKSKEMRERAIDRIAARKIKSRENWRTAIDRIAAKQDTNRVKVNAG